jgi:hypothetical protein
MTGKVVRCGDIANPEYVVVWKGKNYHRIAYYIAEYGGRWYVGADFNLSEWGHGSRPNIHGTSYSTRQEAINSILQSGIRSSKKQEEIDIFKNAMFEIRQLTLF